MKKRFFSLIVLLLGMTMTALAQTSHWSLQIESSSAETLTVALSEKPVLTTASDGYVLTYGAETVNYGWSELKTLKLVESTVDAISKVSADDDIRPSFNRQAGDVTVTGTKPLSPVKVYNLTGKMVMQGTADANGSVSLSTSALTRGVYVIKTTTSTFKFYNK